MAKRALSVQLNGTASNPYEVIGLTQNPFPQLGKAEYNAVERHLAKLGAGPIPDEAYIRTYLEGFVDLCCANFVPGKMTSFTVTFEDDLT